MVSAMIQARMSSTRLPGKVLRQINGRPMLAYMVERVKAACNVDNVVLVTSIDSSDDAIVELCKKNDILYYRGSLDDLIDRYYQAAKKFGVDIIVRLTGDCPLVDPRIIDDMVNIYKNATYDYIANTIPPKWTVPEGMDVEIFSFKNLERAWSEAKKPSEREHVTFYFWHNPQLFSVYRYNLKQDFSQYRLTVDYPEDFEAVKAVFTNLYHVNHLFTMEDIVNFLKNNPNIYKMNKDIASNQGWQTAFEKDKRAGF